MMHSMFFAFWMWSLFSIDPVLAMPLIMVVLFITGMLVYFILIKRVLKAPMLAQILSDVRSGHFSPVFGPIFIHPRHAYDSGPVA